MQEFETVEVTTDILIIGTGLPVSIQSTPAFWNGSFLRPYFTPFP